MRGAIRAASCRANFLGEGRGLGEIPILFSLFGNQVPSVVNPAARVENIVQKLLENADEERWWSLSRDFQLLAEAAPEAFLSALDQELDQHAAVTGYLANTTESGRSWRRIRLKIRFGRSSSLAWGPQYLGRVSIILAKLAARDPGGDTAIDQRTAYDKFFFCGCRKHLPLLDRRLRVPIS